MSVFPVVLDPQPLLHGAVLHLSRAGQIANCFFRSHRLSCGASHALGARNRTEAAFFAANMRDDGGNSKFLHPFVRDQPHVSNRLEVGNKCTPSP